MHTGPFKYRNGTEAKEGDHVICSPWNGRALAGVIHDIAAVINKPDELNATFYYLVPGGTKQMQVKTIDCIHATDAFHAYKTP